MTRVHPIGQGQVLTGSLFSERLCQVNIARTGFASDEIATRTLDLDTRRLTPDPEGTFA